MDGCPEAACGGLFRARRCRGCLGGTVAVVAPLGCSVWTLCGADVTLRAHGGHWLAAAAVSAQASGRIFLFSTYYLPTATVPAVLCAYRYCICVGTKLRGVSE